MKVVVAGAIALFVAVVACVSFDLEDLRFRCDGRTNTCDPGYACSDDGYCTLVTMTGSPSDASNDGATGEICNNNIDDDGDGLIDCADAAECPTSTTCGVGCLCRGGNGMPTEAACADGLDNDNDGKIDCQDVDDCPRCQGALMCCPDGACRTIC
jgi:hypothetical protein